MVDTAGSEEGSGIIIKRVKKIDGGHHGGAWKVAYADFVTAMMAFFLLMWLLNVSTDEQKEAISSYFDPSNPRISEMTSGAGGLMAGQSVAVEGAMVTNVQPINNPPVQPSRPMGGRSKEGDADDKSQDPGNTEFESEGFYDDGDPNAIDDQSAEWDGMDVELEDITEEDIAEASQEELERIEEELAEQLEEQRFEEARQQIEDTLQNNPEFIEMGQHVVMDMTPEGLRIQIVDQEGRSLFPSGSARMYEFVQDLVGIVSKVVEEMPNQLSIRGHTDSTPYPEGADYTNWELSTDRANALRKAMKTSGIPAERIENVVGRADKEPLLPDDPFAAQNRRISVVLLKEKLTKKEEEETEDVQAPEASEEDEDILTEADDELLLEDSDTAEEAIEPEEEEDMEETETIELEPVIEEEATDEEDTGPVVDPMALPDNPLDVEDPFALPEMELEITPNGKENEDSGQKILFF